MHSTIYVNNSHLASTKLPKSCHTTVINLSPICHWAKNCCWCQAVVSNININNWNYNGIEIHNNVPYFCETTIITGEVRQLCDVSSQVAPKFPNVCLCNFTGGRRQVMAICKDPAGQSSAPMSTSRRNNVMDHNTQPGDILWTPRPWNQRDQEPRTKVG